MIDHLNSRQSFAVDGVREKCYLFTRHARAYEYNIYIYDLGVYYKRILTRDKCHHQTDSGVTINYPFTRVNIYVIFKFERRTICPIDHHGMTTNIEGYII